MTIPFLSFYEAPLAAFLTTSSLLVFEDGVVLQIPVVVSHAIPSLEKIYILFYVTWE